MAANPCDELIVDLSRVDVDVEISGPPCIDVDWLQTDITIEAITVANQGPKGDQGDPGEDGESIVGPSGPPGSPGTAASVDCGTTTTGAPGSAANVVNSGTSSTAIFDFTIPRGDVGATGPMGQGIVVKGSVPNHAALPTTGNTAGDVWVTTDTSHGWAWTGTAWVDIGPIQGPPGAVGPSGPAGSDGAPGAPGTAATVAAGTTTTGAPGTNAAVTNTGTSSAAVFAFTIPRGDVGAAGPAGAPGSIGIDGAPGAPGAAGGNAWTLVTNASFTVPAYGANVTVQAGDTAWVALGEWIYVDDASGPGVAGQLVVTAKTPTTLTLFNPTPTTYPLADTLQNGLLKKVSGLTSDFVDGTNNCQPIVPQITSVRLRSWNSVGNPNFEVCQRNCSQALANISNTIIEDRWTHYKAGTYNMTAFRAGGGNNVYLPGTSYVITSAWLRFTLAAQQTSLGAGDYSQIVQVIEGPNWRELCGDVHSISLLVQSSVANLKFGLSVRDPGTATRSLVKLCTIPTANTWTLITLPNLPVFPPAGSFSTQPGVAGYQLTFCLATGSTYMASANDTWLNANAIGAVGQSNFLASPVNSTFDIAFCQHEPGPLCSTLIDKPFIQNLEECQRYFSKTYAYGIPVGNANTTGMNYAFRAYSVAGANGYGPFGKTMANLPTVTLYASNGASNGVTDNLTGGGVSVTGASFISDKAFTQINAGGNTMIQNNTYGCHYTADTGW